MRREKCRHVVVEEGEPRGAEPERIGREIELPAHDGGLELGGAIASVAEAVQDAVEIRKKIDVGARVRRDVLAQPEMTRFAAEVAFPQELERAPFPVKIIG